MGPSSNTAVIEGFIGNVQFALGVIGSYQEQMLQEITYLETSNEILVSLRDEMGRYLTGNDLNTLSNVDSTLSAAVRSFSIQSPQDTKSKIESYYNNIREIYQRATFNSEWFLKSQLKRQVKLLGRYRSSLAETEDKLPNVELAIEALNKRVDELRGVFDQTTLQKLSNFFADEFAGNAAKSFYAFASCSVAMVVLGIVGLTKISEVAKEIIKKPQSERLVDLLHTAPTLAFFSTVLGMTWIIAKHFLQQYSNNQHRATSLKSMKSILEFSPHSMTDEVMKSLLLTLFTQDNSVLTKGGETELVKSMLVQLASKDRS